MSQDSVCPDLQPAATSLIASVVSAWNAHDMDALAALMAPGLRWRGRWRARDEGRRAPCSGLFGAARIKLLKAEGVQSMGRQVAVATCVLEAEASPTPTVWGAPPQERLTLVLLRTSKGWRIAHADMAPLDEKTSAHDRRVGAGARAGPRPSWLTAQALWTFGLGLVRNAPWLMAGLGCATAM